MGNKLQVHRYMCTGVIYFILTTIQFKQKAWYMTIRFLGICIVVFRVGLLVVSDEENPSYWTIGMALQVCNLLSFVTVICGACEVSLYSTRHKSLHEWHTLPGQLEEYSRSSVKDQRNPNVETLSRTPTP